MCVCVWGGYLSVWGDVRVCERARVCVWGVRACLEHISVWVLSSVGCCKLAVSLLAVQGPPPVWVIVSFADEERSSERFHTSVCCLFVCGVVKSVRIPICISAGACRNFVKLTKFQHASAYLMMLKIVN